MLVIRDLNVFCKQLNWTWVSILLGLTADKWKIKGCFVIMQAFYVAVLG